MVFLNQLVSKILIHLLFWALFIFISLFVFSDYYWSENPFLHYVVILIAIVYSNNGVLLPFFIRKGWYFLYALIIGAVSFLGTQLYCNFFAQCGCSIMKCLSDYMWQTLVPIIFFSFLWMFYRYLQKQRELEISKKEHTEMELQYLKSQINPHVLFNNLNTIYSFALEKPSAVPQLILMLSNNLKHVLYDSNTHKVDLVKELDYIENYIAFQKLRLEKLKKIQCAIATDGNTYTIAPLLLITLIENAFKHSAIGSTITIDITVKEALLTCSCRNKIKEHMAERQDAQIGLKNLEKRLDILYKNKHQLKVVQTDEYQVNLKLNLA